MTSIVTVTEMESVRRCGWQHEFNSRNKMGLESANPLKSLFLGTLWHKTVDALAQKQSMKSPHKFIPGGAGKQGEHCKECGYNVWAHQSSPEKALAGQSIDKIREHYMRVTGRAPLQFEMKDAHKTTDLVLGMLEGYLKYYNGRLIPEGWKYIQTEQQFFKVIPGTEYCKCYLQPKCNCNYFKNGVRKSCRIVGGRYTECRCGTGTLVAFRNGSYPASSNGWTRLDTSTSCKCRDNIVLEGTLDGLIQHETSKIVGVLENKTFSVHPHIPEMHRTSQFMGYNWIGSEFGVSEMLYNGIWTRTQVPDGWNKAANRKWNIHDLYVRRTLSWDDKEVMNWVIQLATDALRVFDPYYFPTRTVHPVGGCNGVNGCGYKTLCDARFHQHRDYNTIMAHEYRKRDSVEQEEEVVV